MPFVIAYYHRSRLFQIWYNRALQDRGFSKYAFTFRLLAIEHLSAFLTLFQTQKKRPRFRGRF